MKTAAPRISMNKLMEYMTALPSRQREIVDNQKNPLANKPKMAWCASARRAIIEFFADGCVHESILDDEIERLQERIENLDIKDPKKLESKERQLQVEIDAINSFKGLHKEMGLKGVLFSKVSKKPKYLDFSGVHVSVYPEILILTKDGWEHIGCLKLYFTKNRRLQEDEADFLCSILNHYADTYLSPNRSANPKACIAIDVFGHRIFTASKNVALHKGEIRKTCQEIHEMWATIPKRKEIKADDDGQSELNFSE
jgi:hypothetical protein